MNGSEPPSTRLYLLDYGAGNVRSLANSLTELGYTYEWITSPEDFDEADVRTYLFLLHGALMEHIFSNPVPVHIPFLCLSIRPILL